MYRSAQPDPGAIERLLGLRHPDPFEILGRHFDGDREWVRVFLTNAQSVVIEGDHMMKPVHEGLFEWSGPAGTLPPRYRLTWLDPHGLEHSGYDPYCFAPQISEDDLQRFCEGRHFRAHRFLGSRRHVCDGVEGSLFAVWAPNAERVSIVGDFNRWDHSRHLMRLRGSSGVWELFIPAVTEPAHYKFEIRNRLSGAVLLKNDPYAERYELRPKSASILHTSAPYQWNDDDWMQTRARTDWLHQPLSIYEVHLASWRRPPSSEADPPFPRYRDLAHELVEHVTRLGFTHIELMPVTEHPLDASWGYQTTGYFAATSRYGEPDELRYFVDYCHRHGVGVLADWTPAHFPRDTHALARFDGTPLYEHWDSRRGEHPDWDTLIFNYARHEVRSFLLSSAIYWLEAFHIDGLRVDAVASMLYLDYSRQPGQWLANQYGGKENLEAISLLRELNEITHREHPGTLMIAEESTSWPQVTRPTDTGGLGFSMKWNMGWMHDTLKYFAADPIHRPYHHEQLTFGLLYSFSENFVLPLSHDEVVHGKRSLLGKMPGDQWRQFANLRLLYTFMWTYPGKKLLFMGGEHGEWREWNFEGSLNWSLNENPLNSGLGRLLSDLNQTYRRESALHRYDFKAQGFEWIDFRDVEQSVISYQRQAENEHVVVILNFTPVPRHGYRIGVPHAGRYAVALNSDDLAYGGTGAGNVETLVSEPTPCMGHAISIVLTLPPLGGLILSVEQTQASNE